MSSQEDFADFATAVGAPPRMASGRRSVDFTGLRPGLMLSCLFALLLAAAAIAPGQLGTGDPLATDAHLAFAAPSAVHLLGTDENGRDELTRLIYGVRPSLLIGLGATAISVVLGTLIGLGAGLGPRWVDMLVMRFTDVLQSFHEILLAMLIIAFLGAGTENLLLALGIAGVSRCARQVRAQAHLVRRMPYVEAAETLGIRHFTVVWRHVLPNAIRPALVLVPISIGMKIAAGATLSFLGLGAPPPAPQWGSMLAIGRDYLLNGWWLTAIPAVAIIVTVLSITTLGRELARRSEGRAA